MNPNEKPGAVIPIQLPKTGNKGKPPAVQENRRITHSGTGIGATADRWVTLYGPNTARGQLQSIHRERKSVQLKPDVAQKYLHR